MQVARDILNTENCSYSDMCRAAELLVGTRLELSSAPMLGITTPCVVDVHESHKGKIMYSMPVPGTDWEPSDYARSLGMAWKDGDRAYGFTEVVSLPIVW